MKPLNRKTGDRRAWISNIAFPTSVEELLHVLKEGEGLYDTEVILRARTNVEWTAPTWARRGDIVFFMHSVSAINKIRKVRKEVIEHADERSAEENELLREGLERALELYRMYGGKLIGAAQLGTDPRRGFTESFRHWKGRNYAAIIDTTAFSHPLDRKCFTDQIQICRTGGVTPIFEAGFNLLIEQLSEKNTLPAYLTDANVIRDDAGSAVFDNEEQFRTVRVEQMLRKISPVVYRECRCGKSGVADSFADNVILIEGRFLPVEVKIVEQSEAIVDQLWKYCNNDSIEVGNQTIDPERVWRSYALLVDPWNVSIYKAHADRLQKIMPLPEAERDVFELRDAIIDIISEEK